MISSCISENIAIISLGVDIVLCNIGMLITMCDNCVADHTKGS